MHNPYAAESDQRDSVADLEFGGVGDGDEAIRTVVRTSQIITFGLIQGVFLFCVVALFINQAKVDGNPELITWIALAFAGLAFMSHLVIPQIVIRVRLAKLPAQELALNTRTGQRELMAALFQTQLIIKCAILEGAAMFNAIAYLLEKSWIPLAAAGVLMALIAVRFPSRDSVTFWVENKIREIQLS